MLIQINADHLLQAHQDTAPELEAQLQHALARFATQVTRVEVYFQDTNAEKSGPADKRCTLEARVRGFEPIAVSHEAATISTAFGGARDKLLRALDRRLGRLRHPKVHDHNEQGLNP